MPNRLRTKDQPCLRQHADNPVDWWPLATRRSSSPDAPTGGSDLRWALLVVPLVPMMAHESFEDPDTAALINDRLCRSGRPRRAPRRRWVYMEARRPWSARAAGRFADADGRPFCGTYFPPETQGRPARPWVLGMITRPGADSAAERPD